MHRLEEHLIEDAAWGAAEPRPRTWRSGRWSLELRHDELAELALDGRVLLRAVRAVARDRDWATVPVRVTRTVVTERSLAVELRMHGLGADLTGSLLVDADEERLTVTFTAVSRTGFLRNRIGLVVLHPPTVAGAPLAVVHADGRRSAGRFPLRISPAQPAVDVRRLEWTSDGAESALEFAGDVFEMEDQRNWTDASFKTYSTPLAAPFPVLLPEGATVRQSLTLTARTVTAVASAPPRTEVVLLAQQTDAPTVSLGASTAAGPSPDLPAPTADGLLVELDLTTRAWRSALARAVRDARGLPLDVRLVTDGDRDLDEAVAALAPLRLHRIGVFAADTHVTEPALHRALVAALGGRDVAVVGGTRAHFTELNRTHERIPPTVPALTFSVTPQMHARERAQLVESIAIQRRVALDAVAIAAGRPVHIGPITLRPRFNAVATTSPAPEAGGDASTGYGAALIDADDPRQTAPALAAWTVASAAASSVPGVAGLTYFEQWGPRGVVSASGREYPVARAIHWLHELSGLPVLTDAGAGQDGLWAIAGLRQDTLIALVANLGSTARAVTLSAPELGVERRVEIPPLTAIRETWSPVLRTDPR